MKVNGTTDPNNTPLNIQYEFRNPKTQPKTDIEDPNVANVA